MKRTTLVLEEQAFTELKMRAAEEGRTLSELVNEFIRSGLLQRRRPRRRLRPALPAFSMGAPAVDLADRDQLYDRMEGR